MKGGEMRFRGKVAIVTGAGGGLGAVYATALAREGAAVVVVDRPGSAVEAAASAICATGSSCLAVTADLTEAEQVSRLIETALAAHGRIDILINNAGGGSSSPENAGSIAEETPESWDLLVDSNLKTAFLCTRAAAEPMKRQRYGKIVNISSRSARIADPNVHQSPAYACAKTAVLGLTRFAARDLGPHGITVNCVVPCLTISGPVLQAYWDRMGKDGQEEFLRQFALRRLPRPEELASAVLFLCSDESSCITGVALDVNCGSFMP
jgi:NAD(P)-dependent dehydrogenase (short-subunit alcohol dehydrogenase family)